MKPVVLQDPRRYFEQTAAAAGAGPDSQTDEAAALDQMSTTDVLQAIDPHCLQSGMDPAAAKQVRFKVIQADITLYVFNPVSTCELVLVSVIFRLSQHLKS